MTSPTPATQTLYKVLHSDGSAYHGGNGKWFLPKGGPGKWMPTLNPGKLEACQYGYHLCRRDDLIHWLGPVIFTAEYRGKRIDDTDKIVVQQARLIRKLETWNDRTARLFACDCADRALALIDKPDPRSIESVRVARLYSIGEATKEQLAAARAAAWDAAWDAERKWQTKRLFEYLERVQFNRWLKNARIAELRRKGLLS